MTGTEEEKFTANFIKERLLSYGYEVEVQEFSIPDKRIGHLQTADGDEVLITIPSGSAATAEEGLTAPLYDAGLGYASNFSAEAVGKIALISRGELTFQQKVENAHAAGAIAVLIYNNIDQAGPLNPSINDHAPIPVGGITKVSGEALLADVLSQKWDRHAECQDIWGMRHRKISLQNGRRKRVENTILYMCLPTMIAFPLHRERAIMQQERRLLWNSPVY